MIHDSESAAYLGVEPDPYPLGLLPSGLRVDRVVEVGSGSGEGAMQVAVAFPEASVTCLEPGDAARSTTAWRLRDRGLLDDRVAILPLAVEGAAVLLEADLVVARHVTCQVPVADRASFWRAIAAVLGDSGVVLIDDHFGAASGPATPRRLAATGASGRFRVERWFEATPLDGGRRRVRNEYVFTDPDGVVVHREEHVHVQEVVDPLEQATVIARAGLEIVRHEDGWLLLRHATVPGEEPA